jgi:esterase
VGNFTRHARADRQWDALEHIEARTLLVRGEHSELLTRDMADEMIRRMKDASLVEIPDGSHDLGVQQPEAVARAVRAFLKG